ncbi:hypothetical protein [Nitrospira sp. Kam-Ns4a]
MSGFDLIVLGTLVSLGGGLLFARRYWVRAFPAMPGPLSARECDPLIVRDGIIRHSEAMAGVRWLTIGVLALGVGATREGEPWYLVGFWSDILLHVTVLSGCWFATLARAKRQSRRQYLPLMVELHRKSFDVRAEHLAHDGYTRYEIDQGLDVAEGTRRHRLAEGSRYLDQIGLALDVLRASGESDRQYVERLRPYFQPLVP